MPREQQTRVNVKITYLDTVINGVRFLCGLNS